MKLKVYCDSGGFIKALNKIENLDIIYYPYENINKRITRFASVSKQNWEQMKYIPFEEISDNWKSIKGSEKYEDILKIVGKKNELDAKHLDSAYKTDCQFFLSSDNDDIVSKREYLEPLLGFKIFLIPKEWEVFMAYL